MIKLFKKRKERGKPKMLSAKFAQMEIIQKII